MNLKQQIFTIIGLIWLLSGCNKDIEQGDGTPQYIRQSRGQFGDIAKFDFLGLIYSEGSICLVSRNGVYWYDSRTLQEMYRHEGWILGFEIAQSDTIVMFDDGPHRFSPAQKSFEKLTHTIFLSNYFSVIPNKGIIYHEVELWTNTEFFNFYNFDGRTVSTLFHLHYIAEKNTNFQKFYSYAAGESIEVVLALTHPDKDTSYITVVDAQQAQVKKSIPYFPQVHHASLSILGVPDPHHIRLSYQAQDHDVYALWPLDESQQKIIWQEDSDRQSVRMSYNAEMLAFLNIHDRTIKLYNWMSNVAEWSFNVGIPLDASMQIYLSGDYVILYSEHDSHDVHVYSKQGKYLYKLRSEAIIRSVLNADKTSILIMNVHDRIEKFDL